MDLGLSGRVFVVTGGSRGLGRATVAALTAEGASVLVAARDEEAVARVVAAQPEGSALGLPADLGDETAPERLVAAAAARFGRVDGAFVSVGGPPPGSAMTTTDTTWRDAFETAFLGPLRMARAVAHAIPPTPGRPTGDTGSILFVLSSSVRSPIPGLATSNGLRPGLAMLVKDLADELGPRGIRVNGVMPGRIATDRIFALDARMGAPDVVRRRQEAQIPLGRYGEPEEFARVAAFLLSAAASYVDGTVVAVDGGLIRTP